MGNIVSFWKIVHNYHVQFGRTASNLHPDFDLIDYENRLTHVIFLKPSLEITRTLASLFSR